MDAFRFPFQFEFAGVAVGDRRGSGVLRRVVDEAAARRRDGLDARRGVHPVADDDALFRRRRRRRAGRDADAGIEWHAVLVAVRGYRRGEVERRPDGAFGVIFLCDGRAPHRHHGVADELLDRSAIAGDDRSGELEVTGQEFADFLGIP